MVTPGSPFWAQPVPIFPLPGIALFPHALLPLHVFEPRYRELVRDALAGGQLIAPAALLPGYEADYHGRPPVAPVCGVGRIIGHEALPDGRSNLLLRGVGRARIIEELPPEHSYRLVRLQPLPDLVPPGLDAAETVRTMVLLADQVALRLPSGGETLQSLARSQSEPGPLADALAAALITEAPERQALLETQDVGRRTERITAELGALLTRFADSSGPAN